MKNVVITGSTRGIGLAMAKEFLRAGCQVTLSGRGDSLGSEALEALSAYKENCIYVPGDVRKPDSLQNLWDQSAAQWGEIDIWINNAGQNTPHTFVWEIDPVSTENVVHTNLLGLIYGSQIAAAAMIRQGHGAIYSMEGLGSNNMIQPKTILYGTTKHALTYFMKGLAKELEGTGVLAGRLSPGMMLTDFITQGPDRQPSEVLRDARFARVFNILGDHPETVAAFLVPHMLRNRKNDARISWLTSRKTAWRFLTASKRKGRLIPEQK